MRLSRLALLAAVWIVSPSQVSAWWEVENIPRSCEISKKHLPPGASCSEPYVENERG